MMKMMMMMSSIYEELTDQLKNFQFLTPEGLHQIYFLVVCMNHHIVHTNPRKQYYDFLYPHVRTKYYC